MNTQLHPVDPEILRFKLVKSMPYLATVVYRMQPVEEEGLDTFACDARWRWHYGKLVPFNAEEQVTVLYHEVQHLLRNHFGRVGKRDPKRWNGAGDLEINDEFPYGLTVPTNLLLPEHFELPNGELAEWYYDRLDRYESHTRVDATPLSPGAGPCEVPGCKNENTEPNIGSNHEVKKRGIVHVPKCGGCADGEGGQNGSDGIGEVEGEAVRREVAKQIEQASQMGRGTVPGSLQRWAKELLHPRVRWEKLLKTYTRRVATIISGNTEQTYQKLARRDMPPFILPKDISQKASAAFYIDTSGSIDNIQLAQALTEVRAALKSETADIWVTFLDAEIQECKKVSTSGQAKLLVPKGGGGTDMRLAFDHAKTLRPKPNLLVVITDGETPWPSEPPTGVHTIVVWTARGGRWGGSSPPWAKTIKVDAEGYVP